MKAKELIEMHMKLEAVPYEVWTAFSDTKQEMTVAGDQISFGGDYKSVPEMREALEWYAAQLGGTIKWSKN